MEKIKIENILKKNYFESEIKYDPESSKFEFIEDYHQLSHDEEPYQDIIMSKVTNNIGFREVWYKKPNNPKEAIIQLNKRYSDDISQYNWIMKNETISHYLNNKKKNLEGMTFNGKEYEPNQGWEDNLVPINRGNIPYEKSIHRIIEDNVTNEIGFHNKVSDITNNTYKKKLRLYAIRSEKLLV